MSFYYLHSESKDLIWKKFEPESDSPFVVCIWPCDISNRAHAWAICLEGLALGAKVDRVKELATKWQLTPGDALEYMARVAPSPQQKERLVDFMAKVHGLTEEAFWELMDQEAEKRMGRVGGRG